MSLTINLQWHDRPINLDVDDDGVEFVVEVEKHETFCRSVRLPYTRDEADSLRQATAHSDVVANLVGAYMDALRLIDEQAEQVTRVLSPSDARALAAALEHYADEAER